MRQLATTVFAILASWLVVTRPSEAAPLEQWTGDYLYTTCRSAYESENTALNAKKLSDISWCNGALVTTVQALTIIHKFFDGLYPKRIDPANTKEVQRYFAGILMFGGEVCFTDNVSLNILSLALSKFARENPQTLTMPSLTFATVAFQSAFPCNRIK